MKNLFYVIWPASDGCICKCMDLCPIQKCLQECFLLLWGDVHTVDGNIFRPGQGLKWERVLGRNISVLKNEVISFEVQHHALEACWCISKILLCNGLQWINVHINKSGNAWYRIQEWASHIWCSNGNAEPQ